MSYSKPFLGPSFSLPRRRLLGAAIGSLALPFPLLAARHEHPLAEQFDVVVVGSGLAGLCAAVSAKETGARSVLVLEKGPLLGGHSIYSSGSIAAVVHEKGSDGFADTPEQFVEDALRVGGGTGNPAILRRIANESEAGLRWLEGMGVIFGRPFVAHSGLRPRSFSMLGNSAGRSYVMAVSRRAVSQGIELRLRARVTSLCPGDNGWALGWRKEGENVERTVEARSVVLATGGFTANVARRMRINPMLTPDVGTSANPDGTIWDGADGDGLDLAESVGGALAEGFGLQLLPYWGGRLLDYAGGDIYLDAEGRRFVNEAMPWNPIAEKILQLPERTFWIVTDRKSFKGATLGLKLINGIVRKADSVEALAEGMRVRPEILAKTLADYNRAAEEGLDPLTGKTIFTQTIDTPPFYYGEERIYVHTTLDGIRTNEEGQVLKADGSVLPGLYAAGETVGGIFGMDRLGGAGLANCLVMGRVCGRNATARQTERLHSDA